MALWTAFVITALLIVYSGTRLSEYGDIIAERTGLGRSWIGFVLLAAATSMPELISGISAVTYTDSPDIAVGSVVGSCAFNMVILALIDFLYKKGPIFSDANQGHVVSSGLGIVLMSIAAMSIYLGPMVPAIGWVGIYSPVIAVLYFYSVRMLYVFEKNRAVETPEAPMDADGTQLTNRSLALRFAFNTLMIIAAASVLPEIAQRIAIQTGLAESFAGSILVALTTSLPEVVVSVAAVRIGAIDMAIGNVLGSNIFNMMILAIDDMAYTAGPILQAASTAHIVPALSASAMSAIATVSLTYRSDWKRTAMGMDSICILAIFMINAYLLYILH